MNTDDRITPALVTKKGISPLGSTAKGSAFDSSYLFSYMEGDVYTHSFAKATDAQLSHKDDIPAELERDEEESPPTTAKFTKPGLAEVRKHAEELIKDLDDMSLSESKPESAKIKNPPQGPAYSSTDTTVPFGVPSAPTPPLVPNNYAQQPPQSSPTYYAPYSPLQCPSYYQPPVHHTIPYAPCVYYPVISTPPFYSPQLSHSGEGVVLHLIDNIEKTLADQSSCRMVQKFLEDTKSPVIASKLFSKMYRKIAEYMNLPFGNYLCQKLFDFLSEAQLKSIIGIVRAQAVAVCNNLHGTRSIQKLIQKASTFLSLRGELLKLLQGNVCELSTVSFMRN